MVHFVGHIRVDEEGLHGFSVMWKRRPDCPKRDVIIQIGTYVWWFYL